MEKYKDAEIIDLINNLRSYEKEPEWVEFKLNNKGDDLIGEYISALSNGAALTKKPFAYLIWGVDDKTHEVKGTSFDYSKYKVGNEDISLWLTKHLKPITTISFRRVEIDGKPVGVLKIGTAKAEPVKFKGIEYIRRGEHKKKLKDCPDLEKQLWAAFNEITFEELTAKENLSEESALGHLDYVKYFDALQLSVPHDNEGIVNALVQDRVLRRNDFGKIDITNLGAILFAKNLGDFEGLKRKAIRVIKYNGNDRISSASKEQVGVKGYACGFEGLIEYISGLIPDNEIMGKE